MYTYILHYQSVLPVARSVLGFAIVGVLGVGDKVMHREQPTNDYISL